MHLAGKDACSTNSRCGDGKHALGTATRALSPQVLHGLFQRLAAMLAAGTIAPLHTLAYGLHDLPTALRTLAHARHSGKVVVQLPGAAPDRARVGCRAPGGSWAVAGGLGALGRLAAGWLAGHGAHEVALLGRSGRHAGAPTCECV